MPPLAHPGYSHRTVNSTTLVARDWAWNTLADALHTHQTLYAWANAQHSREALEGRGIAWGTVIPAGTHGAAETAVVVRHSRHGGTFAPLTKDLFLHPTRAVHELDTAMRLAANGVPTPEVIGVAVYPHYGIFARSDVMTRRLPTGYDFPTAWRLHASAAARAAIIEAVAILLHKLLEAGAHHPDLNAKNIYVAGSDMSFTAYALDVDRVRFTVHARAAARNLARFTHSVRKWNVKRGLGVTDAEMARLNVLMWTKT